METVSRQKAWEILTKYNLEPFHLQHAQTVEGVMKWFADDLGYGDDVEYWGVVGLLHDVDFELHPTEHCIKAPELLSENGIGQDVIRSVVSHGYGLTVDVKPEHEMEKVLYAVDELTGLIWATALMRPSKSVSDLEVKSVKKKFKTLNFAAGCSRPVIEKGAAMLGWDLDKLIDKTIQAMRSFEIKDV
ncbi:MAG: hydrolase [Deltaproteobacteria bacterium]|jgi:predicted hydrolase (HD superfamily)|nr:hydrolase [Deltaproteobacteria bacterium]